MADRAFSRVGPYSVVVVVDPSEVRSADEFSLASLCDKKGDTTISVCLPARNEASTIGPIVDSIVRHFGPHPAGPPLVDEVIVMDDRSTDATGDVAARSGATVIEVDTVLPDEQPGAGKGNVLWKSVAASAGDIVVWLDADLRSFTPSYVLGLLGPLLEDAQVALVKGFYDRPEQAGVGGGRTTELMARPVLATFFPELAMIRQPLGGEYAARRSILEQVPFAQGYGVETGLLIDIARLVGVDRIAQVDLGVRAHRNRPLRSLSQQAMEVLHAALQRADLGEALDMSTVLSRPDAPPVEIQVDERPPLLETPGYRARGETSGSCSTH